MLATLPAAPPSLADKAYVYEPKVDGIRAIVEVLPPLREDATGGKPESRAQFRARRIERNGTRSAPVTIAGIAGSRASGYPRAAIANGEVVFAWTESTDGGGLQVRTAAASLK